MRSDAEHIGTAVRVSESGFFLPRSFTVVGVVADVLDRNPIEPARAAVYLPVAQRGELWDQTQGFARDATFLVRVDPEAPPSERALRAAVSELDPTLVIQTSTTLEALYGALTSETRFWLALLTTFGATGLVLAAAGTFALLAQDAQQRTREIAVRRALGATTNQVLGRVLGDGVALTATGLILGLAASWYLARLLAAQVVGVEGLEPLPVIGVASVLLAAGIAASWLPARWVGRVDPAGVLREE
jgi:predicted lysophospholipase L1 biosynthesis ABC-type transport system permease subunit